MKIFMMFAFTVLLVPLALGQQQTFVANPEASEVKMTLNTTHEVVHGTLS